MVKKHVQPNPQRNIKGGIAEQEAAIHISNVMLVCGELRANPCGSQVRRRHQGSRLQEVRQRAEQDTEKKQ